MRIGLGCVRIHPMWRSMSFMVSRATMLVSIDPDVTQGWQDKMIQDGCQVVRDVEGCQFGEVYRGSGAA